MNVKQCHLDSNTSHQPPDITHWHKHTMSADTKESNGNIQAMKAATAVPSANGTKQGRGHGNKGNPNITWNIFVLLDVKPS